MLIGNDYPFYYQYIFLIIFMVIGFSTIFKNNMTAYLPI